MGNLPGAVSVIVPTYRRPTTLVSAIRSVLTQQDCPPCEVVVVDDADDPTTRERVRSLGDDRIRYIPRSANLGVGANIATAIASDIRHQLVAILNDDDWWAPDLLNKLVHPLLRHREATVAFSDHWVVDSAGSVDQNLSDKWTRDHRRDELRAGLVPLTKREMIEHEVIPSYIAGVFRRDSLANTQLIARAGQAYDLAMTYLAVSAGRSFYFPERLAFYRWHDQMLTLTGNDDALEGRVVLRRAFFSDPDLRGSKLLRSRYALALTDFGISQGKNGKRGESLRLLLTALCVRPQRKALRGLLAVVK